MFTGPIDSNFCFKSAARLVFCRQRLALEPCDLRIFAQYACFHAQIVQAGLFLMLQV